MHFDITKIKHLPNSLTSEEVDSILQPAILAPKIDAEVATFVDGEDTKIKHSEYCNANLVDYREFESSVDTIIQKCANLVKDKFGLTCIRNEVEFVHYNTGTRYWPHADGQALDGNRITRGNVLRDITCVVYLNDEYEGGALNFQFFDLAFRPKPGTVMMYPSSWQYLHSVDTVVGERYALVIWFQTNPHAYSLEDEIITDSRILNTLTRFKSNP